VTRELYFDGLPIILSRHPDSGDHQVSYVDSQIKVDVNPASGIFLTLKPPSPYLLPASPSSAGVLVGAGKNPVNRRVFPSKPSLLASREGGGGGEAFGGGQRRSSTYSCAIGLNEVEDEGMEPIGAVSVNEGGVRCSCVGDAV